MRSLYPFLLLALILTAACKKDNPTPNINVSNSVVAFSADRYGAGELAYLLKETGTTMVSIALAPPNLRFTYEVTGSNGLKEPGDTLVKGEGGTGGSGLAKISFKGLHRYKDGDLTITINFSGAATPLKANAKKEEYLIRNYKDLMGVGDLHLLDKHPEADLYTQMEDITFPDTTFTDAVIAVGFSGVYDGMGHKITNYAIAPPVRPAIDMLGMFLELSGHSVARNIRLEYAAAGIVTPNLARCGGIVGISNGGSIIQCSVKGRMETGYLSNSEVGGIVGRMNKGRIIGCSFSGYLEGGYVGGLSGRLDSAYVNMCYSDYSFAAFACGGLNCWCVDHLDRIPRDTVLNCYAFIRGAQAVTYLSSLFHLISSPPIEDMYIYDNCFSNAGNQQGKAIMYNNPMELNAQLASLTVSGLPAGITPPPGNKPFKTTSDVLQPALLWWE